MSTRTIIATLAALVTIACNPPPDHSPDPLAGCELTESHSLKCAAESSITTAGWECAEPTEPPAGCRAVDEGICCPPQQSTQPQCERADELDGECQLTQGAGSTASGYRCYESGDVHQELRIASGARGTVRIRSGEFCAIP